MFPELFRIGDFVVTSFGLMMFLSFVSAAYICGRQLERFGYPRELAWDVLAWVAIGGIVGAKLYYLALHWEAWAANPVRETFSRGGLVWYGGLIGGGAYGIYFLKKESFPVLKGLDLGGIGLPLGVFFGRLGCWFGGCCFGRVSDHWSAVSFPPYSPASQAQFEAGTLASKALPSLPVLPMQLYEAAACLAIAAVSMFLVHPRKRFDGQVFCFSMIAYAVARFVLEIFRADARGAFLWFSTSQWIGIAIVLAMGVLWARLAARARRRLAEPLEDEAAAPA